MKVKVYPSKTLITRIKSIKISFHNRKLVNCNIYSKISKEDWMSRKD